MKRVLSILIAMAFFLCTVPVAFAADTLSEDLSAMYEEAYQQDAELIRQIMDNMDQLLAEGKIAAANDVKSKTAASRATYALGSYGDILLGLTINFGSLGAFVGHAAIVANDNVRTVESYAGSFSPIGIDGVQFYPNNWGTRSGALLVRPYNVSTLNQYRAAATYSEYQVGKPYNWNFFDKTRTDSFYCSQLVWLAWLYGGIDCEAGSIPNGIIAPADIGNSSNTYIVMQVP